MAQPAAKSEESNQVHGFSHDAMTTEFRVFIAGTELDTAKKAADCVFHEIDRLERILTRFDACSDVGQINLLNPGESFVVSIETMECLLASLWVHHETGGVFDVTVGGRVDVYSEHGRNMEYLQSSLTQDEGAVGMQRLMLDPENHLVTLADDDWGHAFLDLGGIGKGFVLDKCAQILDEWGIENALLDSGTSTVLALGADPRLGDGWEVGVGGIWAQTPEEGTVRITEQALSGSGKDIKGAHVIDPRTGEPARGNDAAWAIAPSACIADALSTAFMVMDAPMVEHFCNAHEGVRGFVPVRNVLQMYPA